MKRLLSFGILPIVIAGCSATGTFDSSRVTTDGLSGKSWQSEGYVDADLIDSSSLSNKALFQDFDVAGYSTKVEVVGTLYDPTTTLYDGYARRYTAGSGWASVGPNFARIATLSTLSQGYATVGSGPSGLFLSAFFQDNASANFQTILKLSTSWQSLKTSDDPAESVWTSSDDMAEGVRPSITFDNTGRAYVTYYDTNLSEIHLGRWQPASSFGVSGAHEVIGTAIHPRAATVHDGLENLCVVFNLNSGGNDEIHASCIDTSTTFALPLATLTLSDNTVSAAGADAATDGEGLVLSVFHQSTDGSYTDNHIYANTVSEGVLGSSTPTQIDSAMGGDFVAHLKGSSLGNPLTVAPSIAYMGDGKFMAAWVGQSPTLLTSTVFYSVYDTDTDTWSDAESIAGMSESYTAEPHHQSVKLFTNGDGQVGIAVSLIYEDSSTGIVEADNARKVLVSRYADGYGWITPETLGDGCDPTTGPAQLANCSRPPTGVVFPSGDAIVLFPDQDSAGNVHLSYVEFR